MLLTERHDENVVDHHRRMVRPLRGARTVTRRLLVLHLGPHGRRLRGIQHIHFVCWLLADRVAVRTVLLVSTVHVHFAIAGVDGRVTHAWLGNIARCNPARPVAGREIEGPEVLHASQLPVLCATTDQEVRLLRVLGLAVADDGHRRGGIVDHRHLVERCFVRVRLDTRVLHLLGHRALLVHHIANLDLVERRGRRAPVVLVRVALLVPVLTAEHDHGQVVSALEVDAREGSVCVSATRQLGAVGLDVVPRAHDRIVVPLERVRVQDRLVRTVLRLTAHEPKRVGQVAVRRATHACRDARRCVGRLGCRHTRRALVVPEPRRGIDGRTRALQVGQAGHIEQESLVGQAPCVVQLATREHNGLETIEVLRRGAPAWLGGAVIVLGHVGAGDVVGSRNAAHEAAQQRAEAQILVRRRACPLGRGDGRRCRRGRMLTRSHIHNRRYSVRAGEEVIEGIASRRRRCTASVQGAVVRKRRSLC